MTFLKEILNTIIQWHREMPIVMALIYTVIIFAVLVCVYPYLKDWICEKMLRKREEPLFMHYFQNYGENVFQESILDEMRQEYDFKMLKLVGILREMPNPDREKLIRTGLSIEDVYGRIMNFLLYGGKKVKKTGLSAEEITERIEEYSFMGGGKCIIGRWHSKKSNSDTQLEAPIPPQSQPKASTPSATQPSPTPLPKPSRPQSKPTAEQAPTPPPKAPRAMLIELEAPIGIMTSAGIPRMYSKVFISGNTAIFGVGGENCIRIDVSKAQASTVSNKPDNYDTFNVKYNSLLNVVLTTIGTCVGIWKGLLPYDKKDMCNSLTAQMNPYFQQYGIRTELMENQWRFFYKGTQITLEDALKEIPINAPFELAKTSSVLDMSSATWHLRNMEMKQELGAPSYSVVPEGTSFFTSSSYICPTCGKFISKALINQSVINVDGSKKPIDKVFTCKYCKELFAPIFDQPLSSGSLYHLKADDGSYKSIIKQMDDCGRRSLF